MPMPKKNLVLKPSKRPPRKGSLSSKRMGKKFPGGKRIPGQ
jgi:hypothetical protein